MSKLHSKPVHLCKSSDGKITYSYDEHFIYAEAKDGIRRLDLFDKHYYKLRVFDGIPILEIDGLRMQLVRDFETPLDYAKEVVKALRIPKSAPASVQVLDTCMGLGYTAIEASKQAGVAKVTTCEFAEPVLLLAKWNPFSEDLFKKGSKIEVLEGSIFEKIQTLEVSSFDFVIHDPPRVSHASDLYTTEFYSELLRVCKPKARLFHYVGSVGKKKGRNIEDEVSGRLTEIGFKHIKYVERLQGLLFGK